MKRKWVFILLLLPLMVSCGYTVQETVAPVVPQSNQGLHRKVVIMPFADYTPASSPYGYWRRNILVMEALQDALYLNGFMPTMQEDVINYLLERGIIQETQTQADESPETRILTDELGKTWSDEMKSELARAIYLNASARQDREDSKYWNSERLITLDRQTLRALGNAFVADYVIRGRLIELTTDEEDSLNPIQTGILPFFFKLGSRTVFGIAKSDEYEMVDKMALGGLLGMAVAPDDFPIEGDEELEVSGHPAFGGAQVITDNPVAYNTLIWGGAGVAAAYLAHKGGKVNRAAVQLRMIVQDAKTGEIIWANRAEVRVTPQSAYAEDEHDVLLAKAIKHAVGNLVNNFLTTRHAGMCVRRDASGSLSTYPRGQCSQAVY